MGDHHDIAREMVALPGWRWLPGMRGVWPGGAADRMTERTLAVTPGALPDLADPATLGAIEHGLLAPAGVWVERVRAADGSPLWCAHNDGGPVGDEWRDSLPAALLDGLRAVAS